MCYISQPWLNIQNIIGCSMSKKLKRLEKLTSVSGSKEKEKRQNWLAAQEEYENCLRQETQLDNFFQHYSISGQEKMSAVIFVNGQRMLGKIREAQHHQYLETKRCKNNEQEKFLIWQSQYHEKKCYEKLTEKRKRYLQQQEKKHEEKFIDELVCQLFARKS